MYKATLLQLKNALKHVKTNACLVTKREKYVHVLLNVAYDNYTALQTKLDLLEARNASLVAENATLTDRLQSCEICLNNLEQYSRRKCVELSGIPEVKDEDKANYQRFLTHL